MMNKWTFFLIVIVLILGSIVWLVNYTIDERSLIGAYVLGAMSTVVVMTIDWAKTNVTVWLRDKQHNQEFNDNMRENLTIATQAQRLQTEQLRTQKQLGSNEPANDNIGLLFDHSELMELE